MAPNSTALQSFASDRKITLLNDIDSLRSHGVSQWINLPQLIVCGDQSSGKSSVLEAISGIPFPRKDNLCTRFATEVVLRHSSRDAVSVSIVAGPSRSEEEKSKLCDFNRTLGSLDEISSLVEDAKSWMGVDQMSSAFSTDILRLEVLGPKQPHLTIVDLPGLIHSENKVQTAADVETVQRMVLQYMKNPRSIILAVISAKNDYANQIVLKLARKVDLPGRRTLGVITKPDTLSIGSESEAAFLSLAQNKDITFRLGWHLLRNRSYETRNATSEARDEDEKMFFDKGVWKTLDRDSVGIQTLREKLSTILFDQIQAELPTLIEELDRMVSACRTTLARLGPSRDGVDQQRLFLLQISQKFQEIVKLALDGSYGDDFFGSSTSAEAMTRRLRAAVQKLNVGFAEDIRRFGQQRRIVEKKDPKTIRTGEVTRDEFIKEIKVLLEVSRGRELPGMYNPLIAGDLFREQSKPWESFAQGHLKQVWETVTTFLELLVSHLADDSTSEAIYSQVLVPLMDERYKEMKSKLEEIMTPYKTIQPITYNHYFTENIQKIKEKRREEDISRKLHSYLQSNGLNFGAGTGVQNKAVLPLLGKLSSTTEVEMDRFACMEILDSMEAYYKVAMKTMIDNIAVFPVECSLISKISDLFSPSSVLQMPTELVQQIAAEPPKNRIMREEKEQQLKVLQAGLDICRIHVSRKLAGTDAFKNEIHLAEDRDTPDSPISRVASIDLSLEEEDSDNLPAIGMNPAVQPQDIETQPPPTSLEDIREDIWGTVKFPSLVEAPEVEKQYHFEYVAPPSTAIAVESGMSSSVLSSKKSKTKKAKKVAKEPTEE